MGIFYKLANARDKHERTARSDSVVYEGVSKESGHN